MSIDRSAGSLLWSVLKERDVLIDSILQGRHLATSWLQLAALMTLCAGAYGAVFGMWHGPRLAVYVALKFPLVLLLTSALTVVFDWIVALVLGIPLRFGQVAVLAFLGLAVAGILLASLSPVAWLFTLSAPAPSAAARTAHNLLYLMHTVLVGGCGVAGSIGLWKALVRTGQPRDRLRSAYVLWLLAYAVVGGEVAWALRPFVGSVYRPVLFLRDDALDGNVYEFIFTDILPHLLGRN